MTGQPFFNIPEFDRVANLLRGSRHEVVSPAELDDPKFRDVCLKCKHGTMEELKRWCAEYGIKAVSWGDLLARDVKLLADDGIEGIVVFPGWEKSPGATLEAYVGRLCGLPILYPDLTRVPQAELERVHAAAAKPYMAPDLSVFPLLDTAESVQCDQERSPEGPIKRAGPLVHGDRQQVYGHPSEDFARTAGIWSAMFGWKVEPRDVPLAMIAVKLSRLRQSPAHEDSLTDIVGYSECYSMTINV